MLCRETKQVIEFANSNLQIDRGKTSGFYHFAAQLKMAAIFLSCQDEKSWRKFSDNWARVKNGLSTTLSAIYAENAFFR